METDKKSGKGSHPGPAHSVPIDLSHIEPLALLGEKDATLRRLEAAFQVRGVLRDGVLTLNGASPHLEQAADVFRELVNRVTRGQVVDAQDVEYLAQLRLEEGSDAVVNGGPLGELVFELRTVQVKSHGQQTYVDAIRAHDVVFGIGPAGTGKTYLAVAMAVQALRQKKVERIVLTRPAVEAGEKLGFLPGTFEEKIDPYLRPLYDALRDFIPFEKLRRFQEMGVLEIAPLAYMRGRTLSRAFVVLDEAQNTTLAQMKMFLTRLGVHSVAVITGDVTQVDLVNPEESGLIQARKILAGTEGIAFIDFHPRDVVRHRLVKAILAAFSRFEEERDAKKGA
jgi:phosphate starvation-inducible protein PhoH and related proteins